VFPAKFGFFLLMTIESPPSSQNWEKQLALGYSVFPPAVLVLLSGLFLGTNWFEVFFLRRVFIKYADLR
jgi:hypothetical protein